MATDPAFASTPVVGAGLPATFDTSLTGPTNFATVVASGGGTNGSKIEVIFVNALGTTVAGMLNIFLHDGSNWHLFDQFTITVVTSSTTAPAFRSYRRYSDLYLPTSAWTLRASHTVTGNNSLLKVVAVGGAF